MKLLDAQKPAKQEPAEGRAGLEPEGGKKHRRGRLGEGDLSLIWPRPTPAHAAV